MFDLDFDLLKLLSWANDVLLFIVSLEFNFSVKGNELKKFRNDIDLAFKLKGYKNFYRNKSEKTSEAFRRSIFVVKDIKKGEKFSIKNIRRIRPGFGVSPVYYEKILGKKSPLNIKKENPLTYKVMQLLKIKKHINIWSFKI